MPTAPLKFCAEIGCPERVPAGRCPAHTREKDRARGTSRERGYNAKWDAYSRRRLQRHPLCVLCQAAGRVVAAEVTDHTIPHKGDHALFWDRTNHQSLCRACNTRKAIETEGGFGRSPRSGRA